MSWKYEKSDSPLCEYQIVSDGVVIAGEHGIEEEAHAKLIAASTDLFEACVKIVIWHGKRDYNDNLLPSEQQKPEIAQAMEAIEAVGFPSRIIIPHEFNSKGLPK